MYNTAKQLEANRRWKSKNKDKVKAQLQRWRKKHPELVKAQHARYLKKKRCLDGIDH